MIWLADPYPLINLIGVFNLFSIFDYRYIYHILHCPYQIIVWHDCCLLYFLFLSIILNLILFCCKGVWRWNILIYVGWCDFQGLGLCLNLIFWLLWCTSTCLPWFGILVQYYWYHQHFPQPSVHSNLMHWWIGRLVEDGLCEFLCFL